MTNQKRTRAQRLAPEERKRQLTRCAIKAFATYGIGRANHAQVASLAKVAVPTVFLYFPTRESLVDAVLNEVETLLLEIIRAEALKKDLTAFEKLLNLLSRYVDAMDSDPDLVKVFLDWTTSFEEYLSTHMQSYLKKLVAALSGIIDDGKKNKEFDPVVSPLDASLMIYSSANMLAQIKFFYSDVDIKHYLISLISAVLHIDQNKAHKKGNPAPSKK